MKLSIERAALLKSLGHVQSVVERRNTIPILSNVKLDAEDGKLALNATDMDIEIVESVAAQIGDGGVITAPAHTLYDIVRKLPEGADVEFDTDGEGKIHLKAGRSKFTLSSLPAEDFPAIGEGEASHTFTMSADTLRSLIDRTRFAVSTEETRYYLNGIYLHAVDDSSPMLRAVATDGHRLAMVQESLPEGASGMPGVIVPRKTVSDLRKLVDESDDEISIGLSDTKVRFGFDDVVLTSRLIDGTFPDYEQVIPKDNDKVMEVSCDALADAVDRVSAISTEKSRAVKFALTKGQLTLSANSPEHGSAVEELEVSYDSDDLEIGFNSRYLLDILQQIDGDSVRCSLNDPSSPTVISDTGDDSALYVLMPMRV